MGIKISQVCNPQDYELVVPNFIYNRFDLFCKPGEFEAVKIQVDENAKVVEYKITDKMIRGEMKRTAETGLWLTPITKEELEALVVYIAQRHPEVEVVSYRNGIFQYDGKHECGEYTLQGGYTRFRHFKIIFPETVDEMEQCVSAKTRSKMRRWKVRAAETISEKYKEDDQDQACVDVQMLEYQQGEIPEEIVEEFFRFKLETKERVYHMTPREYLEKYLVTNCYVMKLGDTIGAIHFSCEQCPTVYCENHAYNPELKDFSLGKCIFFDSLIEMVKKKREAIFLGADKLEDVPAYKRLYGSVEEEVFNCNIRIKREEKALKNVNPVKQEEKVSENTNSIEWESTTFFKKIKRHLKNILPKKVLKFLWRMKNRL